MRRIISRVGVRLALVAVAGVLGALFIGSASATTPRTVVVSVSITGSGTVRVESHAVSCAGMACHQTIRIPRGRVVIRITPTAGWTLTASAGACRSSEVTCSLRLSAPTRIAVTFAAPGSEANPIPLRQPGTVSELAGKWTVTILGAELQDNETIVQVQATLLTAKVTWLFGLYDWMFVVNDGPVGSPVNCTPPAPDFRSLGGSYPPYGAGAVASGMTVTGNLCFPRGNLQPQALFFVPATEFPPPEVTEGLLPLAVYPPYPRKSVWFALQ